MVGEFKDINALDAASISEMAPVNDEIELGFDAVTQHSGLFFLFNPIT